jgi:RNA polymerase sigma factor (sigma-70 family)
MPGDRELIERLAGADRESALAELIRRHGAMVERTALRQVGDPHLAEDIRQSVFLILTHKAASLSGEGSIAGWLYRTTLLAARDTLKIERRRRYREKEAAKTMMREQQEREVELPANFDAALEGMREIYRQAIVLRYLEGRNRAEMAEALELKEGAVDARVSRALDLLRQALAVGTPGLSLAMLTYSLKAEAAQVAVAAHAGTFVASANAVALAKSVMKGFFWLKVKTALAAVCAAALVGGSGIAAVSHWSPPPPITVSSVGKSPLAGLPSAPGAQLARIAALGDNEWLRLGSPAPDPVWGKARGRGWSATMAFAADLRGAFFSGNGPSGAVKPDGHTMDDLWFYDLNGHRWICLYPGTDTATFSRRVESKEIDIDGDGQVVDRTGRLLPVNAGIGYAGNTAYDPDRRQFVSQSWDNCGSFLVHAALDEGIARLKERACNRKRYSPWAYDVPSGRFERYPLAGQPPQIDAEPTANQFLYIPGLKRYFYAGRTGTAFFNPQARAWTTVAAKGVAISGISHSACYDPKRQRIYMGGGWNPDARSPEDNFFVYDLRTATWSKPYPKGEFPMYMGNNGAFFNYDVANDALVVLAEWGQKICVYDPEANSWSRLPSSRPDIGTSFGSGFYDPALNAYFCYFAMGGDDRGIMFVYRYKKARQGG